MIPFVYNPAAGNWKGKKKAEQAARLFLQKGIEVELISTIGKGNAADLVKSLALSGHNRIIVSGGDGTISEAAHGVISSGMDVTLGLIPGGTGNDFLRHFGINTLTSAVEAITMSRTTLVDVIELKMDNSIIHAVNIAGVGFMSDVVDFFERKLKWLGPAGYTVCALLKLVSLKPYSMDIFVDGADWSGSYILAAFCNTSYTGGAMKFAPEAKHNDAMLDMILLKNTSRFNVLRLLLKVFRGTHVKDRNVVVLKGNNFLVATSPKSKVLVDGEIISQTPVSIDVLPKALKIFA